MSSESSFFGYSKEEVTRLIIQSLQDLGYASSAERLGQESGFNVETVAISELREAILQGTWSAVERLLFGNGIRSELGQANITDTDKKQMRFLIREEKYRSLIERGKRIEALVVLQTELQPLKINPKRLNTLSG